jgi:hypothetical protein
MPTTKQKPAQAKPHLIDTCPRSPLVEGRNYGIAYAFCKKDGTAFKTVGPLSPCKDYLNDQVYSEMTGEPFGAYGYHATKQGLLAAPRAYMVMGVLNYKSGGKYPTQEKDTKFLAEHLPNIQKFMEWFDGRLSLTPSTMYTIEPNRAMVEMDLWWAKATFRISLYTLMIRIALECQYDGQKDVREFIMKCNTKDAYYATQAMEKFDRFVAGDSPEQDFSTDTFWHDEGISTWQFPE